MLNTNEQPITPEEEASGLETIVAKWKQVRGVEDDVDFHDLKTYYDTIMDGDAKENAEELIFKKLDDKYSTQDELTQKPEAEGTPFAEIQQQVSKLNELANENESMSSNIDKLSKGAIEDQITKINDTKLSMKDFIKDEKIREGNPQFKDLLITIKKQQDNFQKHLDLI